MSTKGEQDPELTLTDTNVGKQKWSSKLESVIALLGYSIGLPETWKLPFLVYRNGGGAFLIPYTILIIVCGLPLYFLELSTSQFSGKGPWQIWDFCPILRGFGLTIAVINIGTLILDATVQCWSIEYFINAFKSPLPWTTCNNSWNTQACKSGIYAYDVSYNSSLNSTSLTNINETDINMKPVHSVEEFWQYKILRMSTGIDVIGDINGYYVIYGVIGRVILCLALYKSVKTLGKLMYITAILPIFFLFAIWVRALTLPGATEGMKFFIQPDFSKLLNFQIWIEAAFMTFNTLGPGWGGLMMIGCHNKFRFNCLRSSMFSSASVVIIGLFNGLVVFATLGVMAKEADVPVDSALQSGGFSIGFVAYPIALSYFPLPQVWSVLFYLVIILPSIDAMTILTEPFLLVLEEMFPKYLSARRRLPLLIVVAILTICVGLPFLTRAGVYIFQLVVWYIATFSVVLMCLIEAIVLGWVYGGHRISRDVTMMLGRPLPHFLRISLAFITPPFLSTLLLVSIFTYKPPTFGTYKFPHYATAIGWCLAMLAVIPMLLYAVVIFVRTPGTVYQRFQKLFKPNKRWQPIDSSVQDNFKKMEYTFKDITTKEKLLFNLTGSFKPFSAKSLSEEENRMNLM